MVKFLQKFLSLLLIMLTTSFVWSMAQNQSSEKKLLTFGFTKTENPTQIQNDAVGVINQVNRTVSITVPYSTVVTSLKASFTSSEFSKVYYGNNPALGTLATSSVTAWNYTNPVTLTVEAENKSYENYVVTVIFGSPSTENNILTFNGAWAKNWAGNCTPNGIFLQTEPSIINGNNITFNVPYGARLDDLTVYFTISPYATCNITTGTAQDFDADNNNIPEAKTFIITSQSGVSHNYNVLPIVGAANVEDKILSFIVPNSLTPAVINYATQNITAKVPFSTTTIAPMWTISSYAHMFSDAALTNEICPGQVFQLTGQSSIFHFWIQAELKSEVSEFILTVTKDVVSKDCKINYISANYTKTNLCGENYTGKSIGIIGDSTITFNLPYNVNSGIIDSLTFSPLASSSDIVGTVLNNSNHSIIITAEDGITTKTYEVIGNNEPISNAKQILTFGFNRNANAGFGFTWADSTYSGTIDQELKLISVTVPYNTNLYQLKAYFTQSTYSCVSIAESNGTFTSQRSELNINNFSNTLTYLVTAEDGTQERYEVLVVKVPAKTGKDLIDFKLTLLDCFGIKYDVPGVYSSTNVSEFWTTIDVSVKYGTELDSLAASFSISEGASVTPSAGIINFTNPVNFTVTSEYGVSKVYTVTVTVRPENSEKRILSFWFDKVTNPLLLNNVIGSINETTKTIKLNIPWISRNIISNLKPSFTLSTGAVMIVGQTIQTSGITSHDFITPIVFRVWAENCTYVDYYVTVEITNPLDGDICETAIPLTFPVINHFGTTTGFEDDYSSPCSSTYMYGGDKVYTITIPYESYLSASIVGENGSIHILDACPSVELDATHCKGFVGGIEGGELNVKIDEGTYYVIISSAAPTQSFDYLLNMSYHGTGIDNKVFETKLKVYPNPTSDKITINITNQSFVDVKLQLINISGQIIYYKELNDIQNHNEEVDVTSFAKGIYYLKVNDGNKIKFEKIIIR